MRDHFNQVTRKEEGRGHVLYPDPAQATANAARLRRVIMREQREVKIPDVTTNGFPDFKEYQNMPTGIVIYSRLVSIAIVCSAYIKGLLLYLSKHVASFAVLV